jgi:branched-chain amino acid transport system permease protein
VAEIWSRPTAAQRLALLGCLAALAALPFVLELVGEPFYLRFAARVLIFALAALSLNLILGYGGMVSFGHAAFFGVGAYMVAILSYHAQQGTPLATWPVTIPGTDSAFIAWPAAMLACALLAFVIGLVALRTSGLYFIMITLAFAQMLYFLFVSLEAYGGDDGLTMWAGRSKAGPLDLADDHTFYYVVLVSLVVALYLKSRLVRAPFGLVLAGIRQNERRMRALGCFTFRYRLAAFVIAGAVAGLAGALMANLTEFVSPSYLHWTRSGELLVMVIMGGTGTLAGPVAGAVALLCLEELLSEVTRHWMLVLGPILVLIVLFGRGGLAGLANRLGLARG